MDYIEVGNKIAARLFPQEEMAEARQLWLAMLDHNLVNHFGSEEEIPTVSRGSESTIVRGILWDLGIGSRPEDEDIAQWLPNETLLAHTILRSLGIDPIRPQTNEPKLRSGEKHLGNNDIPTSVIFPSIAEEM